MVKRWRLFSPPAALMVFLRGRVGVQLRSRDWQLTQVRECVLDALGAPGALCSQRQRGGGGGVSNQPWRGDNGKAKSIITFSPPPCKREVKMKWTSDVLALVSWKIHHNAESKKLDTFYCFSYKLWDASSIQSRDNRQREWRISRNYWWDQGKPKAAFDQHSTRIQKRWFFFSSHDKQGCFVSSFPAKLSEASSTNFQKKTNFSRQLVVC